jgi:hypothetical protein
MRSLYAVICLLCVSVTCFAGTSSEDPKVEELRRRFISAVIASDSELIGSMTCTVYSVMFAFLDLDNSVKPLVCGFAHLTLVSKIHDLLNGGESRIVGELSPTVIFEFEAYPEPKILSSADLKPLMRLLGTTVAVAELIGCSQQFVSEKLKSRQR